MGGQSRNPIFDNRCQKVTAKPLQPGYYKLRINSLNRGLVMSKPLISSVVFGMLIAGSAIAAEMPLKAPAPPPPVFSWTGWYIGVNGGYAWGTSSTTLDTQNGTPVAFPAVVIPGINAAGANSFNNTGWLAGGQVGYVFESLETHFVFGSELAIDAIQLRGSINNHQLYAVVGPGFPNNGFTITDGINNKTTWLATFLVRGGYDFGGWIPYGTIGPALTRVRHDFNFVDTTFFPGSVTAATFGQVVAGAALGGGIEVRLIDHWSLRGEYLYVDFGSQNGSSRIVALGAPGQTAGTNATFFHGASLKENIARGFLSYKF